MRRRHSLARQLAGLLAPAWSSGSTATSVPGKTTLVRSLLRACGHTGPVKSPTYTLVEIYVISRIYWYHFDFYRFNFPEEFLDAGLGEYFRDDAFVWSSGPKSGCRIRPQPDLVVRFHFVEHGRTLEFVACSEEGQKCLNSAQERLAGRRRLIKLAGASLFLTVTRCRRRRPIAIRAFLPFASGRRQTTPGWPSNTTAAPEVHALPGQGPGTSGRRPRRDRVQQGTREPGQQGGTR
jgi:tRNA threonylcarbamoyladenosine biosynthesis protein TsaE